MCNDNRWCDRGFTRQKRHVTSYKRIPLCKNGILEGRGYAVMGRGGGGGVEGTGSLGVGVGSGGRGR